MTLKPRFHTLVMIYVIVLAVALLTWIVPGGEYLRTTVDGRTQIVPGSFAYSQSVAQGIGEVLIAPLKGFVHSAQIIVFLFVIGGAFKIIEKTGTITAAMQSVADTFAQKPGLQKFFIPVTMTIFSLGGAIFGMCEETMPFVLIFIPLSISLGYDSLVGTAIPFLGAAAGFAGAIFNPFTVGIAQNIAQLPMYSGFEYRIVIWFLSTVSTIVFVMMYAARIKKDPKRSPVYDIDSNRAAIHRANETKESLTKARKMILYAFLLSIVILVYGILQYQWYINEIAALFFALGLVSGKLGKLSFGQIADEIKEGAKDMVGVALIISCARAILVIASDGKILDVMLHGVAGVISNLHPVFAAQAMFISHGIINFFVHSGSAQAALTMPIMAPLADLTGVTRQVAVLAFQFGDGWINPILPTSGVTMGVLGLAAIPWERWAKWLLRLQLYFFILALLLLIPPVLFFFYGPH